MKGNSMPEPERKHNPYVVGISVGGSEAFVGRIDTLQRVEQIICHQQQNAIVLFGQRRMGKTSILKELEKRFESEEHYKPVFFDLLGKTYQSLQMTLQELACHICDKLGVEKPELQNIDEFHQQWLPQLLKQHLDISLVLLLDEFDALEDDAQSKNAQDSFFHYLRDHLLNVSPRINFVFVLGRNIGDLTAVAMSLFKNIASQRISLLSQLDAIQLIKFSEKNESLFWCNKAVEKVWMLTQGHPFLTQTLCSCIWEDMRYNANSNTVQIEHVSKNISNALESGHSALEWLWSGLPPAEKIVSSIIAGSAEKSISTTELMDNVKQLEVDIAAIGNLRSTLLSLKRWDLINIQENELSFRVELIKQWVKEHKPIEQVRDEIDHINPQADALYKSALTFSQGGNNEKAKQLLTEALNLNSNHNGANQLLAEILIRQDLLPEAKEKLEELYNYNPNLARNRLLHVLKTIANQSNDSTEMVGCYERVLEIDPEDSETLNKLVSYLWEKFNNEGQIEIVDNILKHDPQLKIEPSDTTKKSLNEFAKQLYEMEEFDKAIQFYQKIGQYETAEKIQQELALARKREQQLRKTVEDSELLENIFIFETKTDKLYCTNNDKAIKANFYMLSVELHAMYGKCQQIENILTRMSQITVPYENSTLLIMRPIITSDISMVIGFVYKINPIGIAIKDSKDKIKNLTQSFFNVGI